MHDIVFGVFGGGDDFFGDAKGGADFGAREFPVFEELQIMVALIFFSHSRVIGSGSSGTGTWTAGVVEVDLGWRFFLPVFLCGAVGVFLFAWSPRKPPKLPK